MGPRVCDFRKRFQAKLLRLFIVPANTFDNVKGEFPIGFFIWDTSQEESFASISTDIYEREAQFINKKNLYCCDGLKVINDWTLTFVEDKHITKENFSLGTLLAVANDFQHNNTVNISAPHKPWNHQYQWQITKNNLIHSCVYYAVRLCIEHTWINHEDRFLYPFEGLKESYTKVHDEIGIGIDPTMNCGVNDRDVLPAHCATEDEMYRGEDTAPSLTPQFIVGMDTPADSRRAPWCTTPSPRYWYEDKEFQADCLVFTLFHSKNRISAAGCVNHWIPFTEQEVNAKDCFASHFMSDFLQGKLPTKTTKKHEGDLFDNKELNDLNDLCVPPCPSWTTNTLPSFRVPSCSSWAITPAAQKVMDAGRELWRYYHETAVCTVGGDRTTKGGYNPNASFYDIRLYFQGTDSKGKMNNKSEDEHYNTLLANLRTALKDLAKQIEPKVYQYGFLLGE